MMSLMYESLYHHVPSTPSFHRSTSRDAEVPDTFYRPFVEFQSEVMVPSTPVHTASRSYSQQNYYGFTDVRYALTSHLLEEHKNTPDIDLFKGFSEQVVPFTPQRGSVHSGTPDLTPRPVTRKPLPVRRRKELAKTRLAATPLLSANIQTSPVSKERQLSLFSGDDIFA